MKQFLQIAQHRHTLDSQCTASQYAQSSKGIQNNLFSPHPSKTRLTHFDSIPPSQKKHKQQKSSIEISAKQNNLDPYKEMSNNSSDIRESTINIRITNPIDSFSLKTFTDVFYNPNAKSSKNLIPKDKETDTNNKQLHKSGTEPFISSIKECQGIRITTNLIKEQKNFKRDKNQNKVIDSDKTMSYLTVTNPNNTLNNTDKRLLASRVINQSRITLKDYMFMANTSSKKAAQNKRTELKQSRRALRTQPSMQPTPKPDILVSQIRDKYHQQKYHISNDKMGEVLKHSIRDQILNLNGKIRNIEYWMQSHNKIKSQQLILLYNMRNDLQNYNKRFDQSIAKLISNDHELFVNGIYEKAREVDSQHSEKSGIYQLSQI